MSKLTLLFFLLLAGNLPAFAYTYHCTAQDGTHNFVIDNIQRDIADKDKDKAGAIIVDATDFQGEGSYSGHCDEPPYPFTAEAYATAVSPLPLSEKIGDTQWYKLNDYLDASFQVYVGGNSQTFPQVPFYDASNKLSMNRSQISSGWGTGNKGKISLRIRKPFIGFSHFSVLALQTYLNTQPGIQVSGAPIATVTLGGQIVIPQSCEFTPDKIITIDFGNIAASAFAAAGAGNKPAGVNPQTRNIGIQCKNIDAQAMLSLRLEANNVASNAIVSDNPDLGFVLADKNQQPLMPNNAESKIPFQLDGNASASVPISAWPVSITGNKPAEGKFTAEGYLRVDFD
ncbi:fimbrial protein [Kalamiella sp. sgz302252]|uniref:fimbrial protein n=1 Tax=Pantoea sp. sgz302252 TaxID=3341827 RepID=UPI0036D222E5